jgi:hypothetical protein
MLPNQLIKRIENFFLRKKLRFCVLDWAVIIIIIIIIFIIIIIADEPKTQSRIHVSI